MPGPLQCFGVVDLTTIVSAPPTEAMRWRLFEQTARSVEGRAAA